MTLLLLTALALADDQTSEEEEAPLPKDDEGEEDDEGWFELDSEIDLPSALDSVEDDADALKGTTGELPDTKELMAARRELGPLFRGRWTLKPRAAVASLDGTAVELGLIAGHNWWNLVPLPVRVAGQSKLEATGMVGQARGRTVQLSSTAGIWAGPLGVFVGPVGRYNDERWGPLELGRAVGLGPTARLALDLGPVVPWASGTLLRNVWGDRAEAAAFADEPVLDAGTSIALGYHEIRLQGQRRNVATHLRYSLSLGYHLRFRP